MTGLEKREELKNRALNCEMNMEYTVQMRAENIKDSSDIALKARNAVNEAYKKAEGFTNDIGVGRRMVSEGLPQSISDRIRMAEEKNNIGRIIKD